MPGHEFVDPRLRLESTSRGAGIREWLRWRLNRLRCMTPAEVSHRLLRALSMQAERAGLVGSQVVPPADLATTPRPWVHAAAKVDAARYLAAADCVAAGKLDLFALQDVGLDSPPRWNRDPKTGVEAPLKFGKLLDYRNTRLVGDIKYLWELNRHLHLVTLAQAYALSRDVRYFHVIWQHLESWFAACPYRMGPNWSSALEAAIRLINWSVTWQLLGGARSPLFEDAESIRFRQRWLESVYQHARFVRGHFSLHSSANNHLIGEAAGLFIAALTWPHWQSVRSWLPPAKAILEREALLQNAPDGVNREQAASYQQFVLDFLLISLLAGKANGQSFSAAYESRIEAMLEYLCSIMDVKGNVPMFGDADDGLVVRFAQGGDFSPYRSLLATGAVLFQRDEFKLKAAELDDKTRWLAGSRADGLFQAQSAAQTRLPLRQAFPVGGYYILGCDFETDREIRLIADAGPVGYRSIAAHGHADALRLPGPQLEVDVLLLAAVDLRGLDGLNEIERLRDSRLELGEGLFGILVLGHFHPGQTRHRTLGGIAGDLHLALHRKHVRKEAAVGQHGRLDLVRLGVRLRLVEDGREVLECVDKARSARLVHGDVHGDLPN